MVFVSVHEVNIGIANDPLVEVDSFLRFVCSFINQILKFRLMSGI
jgi:hypothetical protein